MVGKRKRGASLLSKYQLSFTDNFISVRTPSPAAGPSNSRRRPRLLSPSISPPPQHLTLPDFPSPPPPQPLPHLSFDIPATPPPPTPHLYPELFVPPSPFSNLPPAIDAPFLPLPFIPNNLGEAFSNDVAAHHPHQLPSLSRHMPMTPSLMFHQNYTPLFNDDGETRANPMHANGVSFLSVTGLSNVGQHSSSSSTR